jgi:hypothetical protein
MAVAMPLASFSILSGDRHMMPVEMVAEVNAGLRRFFSGGWS